MQTAFIHERLRASLYPIHPTANSLIVHTTDGKYGTKTAVSDNKNAYYTVLLLAVVKTFSDLPHVRCGVAICISIIKLFRTKHEMSHASSPVE